MVFSLVWVRIEISFVLCILLAYNDPVQADIMKIMTKNRYEISMHVIKGKTYSSSKNILILSKMHPQRNINTMGHIIMKMQEFVLVATKMQTKGHNR